MLTRRRLLFITALFGATALAGLPARAQGGGAAEATRFMTGFGDQLVAIVNSDASREQKAAQMQPLIDRSVDVDGIAQFVLGRYARVATPVQQQRFDALFHRVLITNITAKLGQFRGVRFAPTQTQAREGEFFVGTLIYRPNQEPNNVQWVVSFASGRPQLIDVVAEGTSLRLTQRSDYGSFLARNNGNVDALLAAMERQVGA